MADYAMFTTTRTTTPDPVALAAAVRSATTDSTAVIVRTPGGWRGKKAAAWSAGDLSAVQNALETTAELTASMTAQREIDVWPIMFKALVLALIDELNIVRAALPTPLPARTPGQAINAIRNKAGTL